MENKSHESKKQEIIGEKLLKRHPIAYNFVFGKKKYAHIFKALVAVVTLFVIIFINSTGTRFGSDSLRLTFYLDEGVYKLEMFNPHLQSTSVLGLTVNELKKYDGEFFFIEASEESDNLLLYTKKGFSFMVINEQVVDFDKKTDFLFINTEVDSAFVSEIDARHDPYIIFLNKKSDWVEKRNYIVYGGSVLRDDMIVSESGVFIVVKKEPFGIRYIESGFNKEK